MTTTAKSTERALVAETVKAPRYELFDDLDELVHECDTLDEAAIAAKERFEHCVALQLELYENDKHGISRLVGWFAA